MPESKNRPQHHSHQQPPGPNPLKKKPGRAMIVSIVFFALLGLGISYFIGGDRSEILAAGALVGAIAGFLFGYQVEKALAKK